MSAEAIPSTVQNLVVLDLSASYGALIIAAYISCALWGINVMQTYIYYWSYPDDSWPVKMLVAFLLIIDTVHKILITKVPWFTLVQNWGRVSAILASPEEALHEAWVGAIIVVVVQLYFLRRIAKFAATTRHVHSWWLWLIFIVLVGLAVSQVPLTVAYCVFSINRANIFIPINLRIKRAGLIAAAVVDFVNAGAMIMLLKDTDSADGQVYRTSRTIRRLTVITINTGLVTAVVAIISLILDETASGTVFWTAIAQYPQCSIYLSAFLANLNGRRYIRGGGDGVTISNIEDIRFAATTARGDAEASLATRGTEQHTVLGHLGSGATSSGTEGQETTHNSAPEKFSH
ncbi:NAD-P-binding protein [Mycena venus]|uniref:NAD-P-binding protein n=1 Tax=Mycena venus TaxID=2733690 RepID=A0A8H6Y4V1_9AGAR|nr:NAD-P-binding protein [Mycena venus]